ncbi:MAG: COX15/CtaA family protein [Pseudomonadota bacterium]
MATTIGNVEAFPSRTTRSAAAAGTAVRVWLAAVIGLVLGMIVVGGATRLTDSGLSITEWLPLLGAIPPLSDADWAAAFAKYKLIPEYTQVNAGMSLAEFKFIYWWEWGHRFLGRFIGIAYALPLAIFWMRGQIPSRMKPLLLALLVLGGLQGFVGWYMVQSGLVDRIDVSQYRLAMHLSLAFLILGLLTVAYCALRPAASHLSLAQERRSGALGLGLAAAVAVVVLVYAQVALGAFVAGTKAGLTYNTWPLMDGAFVPDGLLMLEPWYLNATENITAIQFNHRISAYVLLAAAIGHAVLTWRWTGDTGLRAGALLLLAAVIVQAIFGVWTLVAAEGAIPIGLGLIHQGGAAVVLVIAVAHAMAWYRHGRSAPAAPTR